MTYFCRDSQALNLLCTPASINVRLHRQVKCTSPSPYGSNDFAPGMEDVEDTGRAVWWPIDNEPRSQDTRKFQGEIHLAKTLKPTSAISHFTLKVSISRKENYLAHNWNQYFVIVMPFDATGFSSVDTRPLIRQEVNIATVFAKVRMSSQHQIFT
jgi:hypothetical protein